MIADANNAAGVAVHKALRTHTAQTVFNIRCHRGGHVIATIYATDWGPYLQPGHHVETPAAPHTLSRRWPTSAAGISPAGPGRFARLAIEQCSVKPVN